MAGPMIEVMLHRMLIHALAATSCSWLTTRGSSPSRLGRCRPLKQVKKKAAA